MLVSVGLLWGTAHAELRPRYGGTIEVTLLGAPASFDPVGAKSHADVTVIGLVFDTLYVLGPDGAPRPHLAAAPPVFDEKHTTARIELKKGLVFQDGTAITAQDVAASLERARTSLRYALPIVTAVHADGDAVELSLAAPPNDLAALLALPQLSITKSGSRAGHEGDRLGAVQRRAGRPRSSSARAPRVRQSLRRPAVPRSSRAALVRHARCRGAPVPDRQRAHLGAGRPRHSPAGPRRSSRARSRVRRRCWSMSGSVARIRRSSTIRRFVARSISHSRAVRSARSVPENKCCRPAARSPVGRRSMRSARPAISVRAQASLAEAARRSPELGHGLRLEILVEDTRPDDRDIAERVGLALDKLGIAWSVAQVSASTLRERVASGKADLWIGQIAEPFAAPAVWWGAAFAAGGDEWPVAALQTSSLDVDAAAKAFAERAPIVPLMFRSVRMWYRSDVHGIAFDAIGRPCFADAFSVRRAAAEQTMKLRGRFTVTLALAALVPITLAAVITTRSYANKLHTDYIGKREQSAAVVKRELAQLGKSVRDATTALASKDHPFVGALLIDLGNNNGAPSRDEEVHLREQEIPTMKGLSLDILTITGPDDIVLVSPHYRPKTNDPNPLRVMRQRAEATGGTPFFTRDSIWTGHTAENVLVIESAQVARDARSSVVVVAGNRVTDDLLSLLRGDGTDARIVLPSGEVLFPPKAGDAAWATLAKDPPVRTAMPGSRWQCRRVHRGRDLRRWTRSPAAQQHPDRGAARARCARCRRAGRLVGRTPHRA